MPDTIQPIRICHLTSSHRALDTRIFNREAISLYQAGYIVVVVGRHPKQEILEGVNIIPLTTKSSNRLRLLIEILKIALRQRAAVYHFHDPDLILVGLILKLLGKKVIYDVHEDYEQNILSHGRVGKIFRNPASLVFRWIECLASSLFDFMIVADTNIEGKFKKEKTERISNAPPKRFVQAKRIRADDAFAFRVVYLGLVSKPHGIGEMLDALNRLKHKDSIELHLIGDSASELQKLWVGNRQVVFHGRVPWEQMHKMLADADVGLLLYQPTPAHRHFTGEGNTKLFEYMGSGLPIIYSDFPKLRKLIEPIGCGIPVDPTDPQKIAEAIDELFESPERRAALGAKGRLAVQEQYNWEVEEQKLLKVYERVLSTR
jgi:glycosyltransferase involved in cell wall biosynthesis